MARTLGSVAGLAQEALHRGGKRLVRMLQEDRAGVANRMEDAAIRGHLRRVDRMVRRVLEIGKVEAGELQKSAWPSMPSISNTSAASSRPSSAASMPRCWSLMPLADLHAHDGRELALAQLGLDHLEEIVGLLLVALGDRVARDPEQLVALDLHAREQEIEVERHHILERHEHVASAHPQEARDAGTHRHLDAGHARLLLAGIVQRDHQVEREVGDERERVRGIDGLGRDQREDVLEVVLAQVGAVLARQVVVAGDDDVVLAQLLDETRHQVVHALLERAHDLIRLADLLPGGATVHGQLGHARALLLLEAADALHEELVEIRRRDGQELDALEQRRAPVLTLVQDAPVEVQPGELAVEIELGVHELAVDPRRVAAGGRRRARIVIALGAALRGLGRLRRWGRRRRGPRWIDERRR